MNCAMGLFLGEQIGLVKQIDLETFGNCIGKFIRVRVLVDLSKPLKRAFRIKFEDFDDEQTLLLRYGKLPVYCFRCDFLGHNFKEGTSMKRVGVHMVDSEYKYSDRL
ncbi:hypothetical protein ACOSP7_026596 [Xanthoceras sorbifolium]